MTQDEIIEMARQAGIKRRTDEFYSEFCDGIYFDDLEAYTKLVAVHTLMHIDPSKFISHQEGIEAGRLAEREACAKVADGWLNYDVQGLAEAIRARGQA
jgi:hypothetical protein